MNNQQKLERLAREDYIITENPHRVARFTAFKGTRIWTGKTVSGLFKLIFGY